MQKLFRMQKIMAWVYTAVALAVFLYTLVFMTEYKDLFGLKLKQNSQISFFHDSVLQTFNRQIFTLALIGIVAVLFSFVLEIFSKVPDFLALAVILAFLAGGIAGAVYAITNIQAVEAFYRGLDIQYLHLEGLTDYVHKFTTFRVGMGVYLLQIASCTAYGAVILMSHITFKKRCKGAHEHE